MAFPSRNQGVLVSVKTVMALIISALVAGVVLGSFGIAGAGTSTGEASVPGVAATSVPVGIAQECGDCDQKAAASDACGDCVQQAGATEACCGAAAGEQARCPKGATAGDADTMHCPSAECTSCP